ncbi:PD-(D/E)XK nuclease family protein [Sphingopyxis terrae]|uniref:PDDEXK-like family protein n=1 Tax=Sphingopyxis terrae TaxID=33052 RepID=UPI003F7E0D9D
MIERAADFPLAEELEKLLVNNASLARLESYLNRFNPIRVMRMERMEIRHSAILAWLLDPGESHGFDDKFLKAFLSEALRGQSALGAPTAIDVARSDLRDAIIRREWQNIDIFIQSEANSWGFVVENKFDSKQHDGQLTKYVERVLAGLGSEGGGLTIRGIFLTLNEEEPEDARFAPITYDAIVRLLPALADREAHLLTTEVAVFLRHYVEIIEEAVGVNAQRSEMEKLARQLYRENRKVLDFIWEYGEGSVFSVAAEELFGEDPDYLDLVEIDGTKYRFNHVDQRMASFLPESWFKALGGKKFDWEGCDGWWADYPLIAWLQLAENADGKSGRLTLYAEVGPLSEHGFRKSLIEAIQQAGTGLVVSKIKFQQTAADEGKRYSKFLKQNSLDIKDVQDNEEISAAMKRLLQRFQHEFDAISRVLPPFIEYGIPA